ncbi:MAG: HEAT repeat domain-containing protein [Gemmataceae bacterium]|nr:HEAT repeat domain-containing protein [Gemmataceae bacterium]
MTAVAWLWYGDTSIGWFTHLSKGVLIGIPILVLGYQSLIESGAPVLRRAHRLADRLASRQDWPADLSQCRALPEVKAFCAALAHDAAPALVLLQHPRVEVRVAALAALQFRKDWRPGQAELVMQIAQRSAAPAVLALGNMDDRMMIEAMARFLNDPNREVRRAAVESLMWDSEHHWGWIRFAIRRTMSDPLFKDDGPLVPDGQVLLPDVVQDLTAWCAEKGLICARAAETLGAHYNRLMYEQADPTPLSRSCASCWPIRRRRRSYAWNWAAFCNFTGSFIMTCWNKCSTAALLRLFGSSPVRPFCRKSRSRRCEGLLVSA